MIISDKKNAIIESAALCPIFLYTVTNGEISSYYASLSAYAAVVNLLIETEDGVYMKFVVAKTRVAPLKK